LRFCSPALTKLIWYSFLATSAKQAFLAIEVTDKFQERLFDVEEDRVVPPCVTTLVKSKFAVHKQMMQRAVVSVAEDTR